MKRRCQDAVARLRMMAADKGETWDLSPNDQTAIQDVLDQRAELLALCERALLEVSDATENACGCNKTPPLCLACALADALERLS